VWSWADKLDDDVDARARLWSVTRSGMADNSVRAGSDQEADRVAHFPFRSTHGVSWTRLRVAALVLLCLSILSLFAYGRALFLPFIADDYVQIQLARTFGPVSGWSDLAKDALYRCRATSLLLTYWTDLAFGLDPFVYRLSSLLLHISNAFLVFALGAWRAIGWRISALAACFFAVSQRHSEAVIWYAALPVTRLLLFSRELSLLGALAPAGYRPGDRLRWIGVLLWTGPAL
jgi:hypothetical protein